MQGTDSYSIAESQGKKLLKYKAEKLIKIVCFVRRNVVMCAIDKFIARPAKFKI